MIKVTHLKVATAILALAEAGIKAKAWQGGSTQRGRTLRDAIAVALEIVPSIELAAGDEKSRLVLREFLLGWVKDYAFNRGVIFEDGDLEHELVEVIAELRRGRIEAATARDIKQFGELEVACPICNAKPGERCSSILDSSLYHDVPHARRRAIAAKGTP